MTLALPDCPLSTKRLVVAQVSLCRGCCCGNVGRGRPDVPVDRLKSEWRARGLSKAVQLTVSGCLGPCDLPNVVRLSTDDRDMWFGNLRSLDDFLGLADWAEATAVAGSAAPLSPRMQGARFDPFRRGEIGRGRLDPGPTRAIPRTEDDR